MLVLGRLVVCLSTGSESLERVAAGSWSAASCARLSKPQHQNTIFCCGALEQWSGEGGCNTPSSLGSVSFTVWSIDRRRGLGIPLESSLCTLCSVCCDDVCTVRAGAGASAVSCRPLLRLTGWVAHYWDFTCAVRGPLAAGSNSTLMATASPVEHPLYTGFMSD